MKFANNLIFKYSPINEFTFKNLILSQMWFGPPDSMNDQFEGLVKVNNVDFIPGELSLKKFIEDNSLDEYYWDPLVEVKTNGFLNFFLDNWFRLERNRFGLTCFSLNPYETLMWSHYTEKHSGVCFIYDRDILLRSFHDQGLDVQLDDVNYKIFPTLTLYERNNSIVYKSDLPVLLSKDKRWSYEEEVRCIINLNDRKFFNGRTFCISPLALKGIIYGWQATEDNKDTLSLILRNDPSYKNVVEYNANIKLENGKLFFTLD